MKMEGGKAEEKREIMMDEKMKGEEENKIEDKNRR